MLGLNERAELFCDQLSVLFDLDQLLSVAHFVF